MSVFMYVCMYVCMCIYIYIYMYTSLSLSPYIYIYIYILDPGRSRRAPEISGAGSSRRAPASCRSSEKGDILIIIVISITINIIIIMIVIINYYSHFISSRVLLRGVGTRRYLFFHRVRLRGGSLMV